MAKKKIKGTMIKYSLIKSAVRSDAGTVFYFSPRGEERKLRVRDRVQFDVKESQFNECSNVKKDD